MYGNNPIRGAEPPSPTLAVQSIFYTLQGEGPYSGMPAWFIRLAGCNLACTFCDTDFESKIDNRMMPAQILDKILGDANPRPNLVVITGGEPMRQNLLPLVRMLLGNGFDIVQIETAGTLWESSGLHEVEGVSYITEGRVVLVCSPKTPKIHPKIEEYTQHFKYIIEAGHTSGLDGLPDFGTQRSTRQKYQPLYRPPSTKTIWVSPMDVPDHAARFDNITHTRDVALLFHHRLSLQVHKIVGVE